MKKVQLILVLMVLLVVLVMPSSAIFEKMFDLGNFTVDTGTYLPAPNAAVAVTKGGIPSLSWDWDTGAGAFLKNTQGALHGRTMITIMPITTVNKLLNMANVSTATITFNSTGEKEGFYLRIILEMFL